MALFLVLLVVFIDWMGIGLVYPIFSSMLFEPNSKLIAPEASVALRGSYLGLLLAMAPLASFFSGPILGMFSDQKGRKITLLYGLIFGIVGYLISAFAVQLKSLSLLIVTRLIVGISSGTASVASAVIADISSPHEKAKNFGLFGMCVGLGFTAGPFLGGILSKDFAVPFLFSGILTLANFLLIFAFFKETLKGKKMSEIKWLTGLKNIKKAFHQPALSFIFLVAFFFIFGWSFLYEFLPTIWIDEYHFSSKMVGVLYGYGSIAFAFSAGVLIRPLAKHFKAHSILLFCLFGLGIYTLLFLVKPQGFWFWAYIPIQQFMAALLYPMASTLVSNAVDEHMQGESLGVLQSVRSASFVISPLVAGPLLSFTSQMPIYVGGGAMLVAALFLAYSKHWKMRRTA